ncbi:hypothetical protein H4S01_006720, partial [Coemansia sp. RSA 2610]
RALVSDGYATPTPNPAPPPTAHAMRPAGKSPAPPLPPADCVPRRDYPVKHPPDPPPAYF